jgi:hypothetical protein
VTTTNGAPRAAPIGRLTVNTGDDILASWGNTTFDQSVECFASNTDRDTQWPSPHDGAACYTVDTATFWVRLAGVWQPVAGPGRPPTTGGSNVATYTDALGDLWISKNGVNGGAWRRPRDVLHARMWRSAAFSLTATVTSLNFDTVERDPYGLYTGAAFSCPVAGLYQVTTAIGYTANVTNLSATVSASRSAGPAYCIGGIVSGTATGGAGRMLGTSGPMACVAGDNLAVQIFAGTTTAGAPGQYITWATFSYLGSG